MEPGIKFRICEDILWRKVGDEILISDVIGETIFGLDGVGARMWQMLAENGSVDEAVSALAAEYDAPADTIAADLNSLIDDLRHRGLVEFAQTTDAPSPSRSPKRRVAR